MFTGVGGFELGFERANALSVTSWNESRRDEENSRGIKSIPMAAQQFASVGLQGDGSSQSKSGGSKQGVLSREQNTSSERNNSFTCVGFSEIDKYCNELIAKRFPGIKNYGDATKINPSELPDFDMLCGGFPCQAFSIAGKRKGFQDTRGTMFFEIARILKVKRPKIVLLENVKGLLNHEGGKTFRTIIQTLSELGYEVQWMVLNSKFFGVPQNRERVFIIGNLRGEPRPEILPFGKSSEDVEEGNRENTTTSNACTSRYWKGGAGTHVGVSQGQRVYGTDGESVAIKSVGGGQGAKTGLYYVTSVAIRNKTRSKHQNKKGEKYGDYEKEYQLEEQKEGVSFTVKGATKEFMVIQKEIDNRGRITRKDDGTSFTLGGGGRNSGRNQVVGFEEMRIRRLTPVECERLQGFPDGWTEGFSDTQRYKMMGNAVTVNVINVIGGKLI